MIDTRIVLSTLWICTMLIFLLGDVFRIISGDIEKVKKTLEKFNQWIWLGIAALMVIPILMAILCLVLPYELNRTVNIVVAAFFFLFNLIGLPSYPSYYDRFLLIVSMGVNIFAIMTALSW